MAEEKTPVRRWLQAGDVSILRVAIRGARDLFEDVNADDQISSISILRNSFTVLATLGCLATIVGLYHEIDVMFKIQPLVNILAAISLFAVSILILSKQIWLNRVGAGNFMLVFFIILWIVSFVFCVSIYYLSLTYHFSVATSPALNAPSVAAESLYRQFSEVSFSKIIAALGAFIATTPPMLLGILLFPDLKSKNLIDRKGHAGPAGGDTHAGATKRALFYLRKSEIGAGKSPSELLAQMSGLMSPGHLARSRSWLSRKS
jgi:hypothetical protein